jgi:LmbE family N-acetylglucosaminyl deacetylase
MELLKEVVEVVRWAKPDIVITHNPKDYMRDHEQTSELVTSAAFCASVNHLVTKSPAYTRLVPVYYMDTAAGVDFNPTDYVDISDTIDIKIRAVECHQSQIKWLKDHDNMDFPECMRMISRFRGNQCSVQYAEGFRHYSGWQRFATTRLLP